MGRNRLKLARGVGQGVRPCQYAMPGSPLLFSSVVPACGFCLQVQSRSRGVKESRSWEANRRPHLSGGNSGRGWVIPELPDSSIPRPRNLASEPGGTTPKKTQNTTNEASMLLKAQEVTLETKLKPTQNEANSERQTCRLNPNSELSREGRVRAGGLRPEMRKGAEAVRSRKPGASREKYKNNTNEASMLLKTQSAFGKRTQKEPKNDARFEHPMPELKPNSEVARLDGKKSLTWLATLATLPDFWGPMDRSESDQKSDSPGKRAAVEVWSGTPMKCERIQKSREQSENVYENKGQVQKVAASKSARPNADRLGPQAGRRSTAPHRLDCQIGGTKRECL